MTRTFFAAAIVVALAACGSQAGGGGGSKTPPPGADGGSDPPPAPALSTITITPVSPTIAVGAAQQFAASGSYSDGSARDLTGQVSWTSSDPSVASMGAGGLVTGVAAGTSTIRCTMAGVTGSATMTVTVPVTPEPPSVTTASLPAGRVGVGYSATLTAAGGTPPFTWAISQGALPAGLALAAGTGAITGTPTAAVVSSFTVQVTDSRSTLATRDLSITIAAETQTYTLFAQSAPANADAADPSSGVELGVRFRSDVDGFVTGVRFYKSVANTGAHVGNLWSGDGTRLATATFAAETASGWQQVTFSSPVPIRANRSYVASYHTDTGHYSADDLYFTAAVDSPPLHAPADSAEAPNGVFAYGSTSVFPAETYRKTNYWVDVLFSPSSTPFAQLEPPGWYAGDMHVHRSCGGSPEALSSIYQEMTPNDLAVISLLADMGNGEVQDPVTDLPLVNGQDASISTPGRIVHWDAEWHWDAVYTQYPHQALGGHLLPLGVSEAHQIWEEYTYPILDWAHAKGGIAGFAHMQYLDYGLPQTLSCCGPIEYPVEVALGSSDFISEDVVDVDTSFGGMDPEAFTSAYYRLLNCGFRPGFAAGTDYPCNDGRALGSLLTYVQVADGQMTYRNWIDGIAKGRTVVSRNGHNEFLSVIVNDGATPGDEVNLSGGGTVPVTIQWTANQGLSGTIELVVNGAVVASKQASVTAESAATLSTTVSFTKSGWLAGRRMGSAGHYVHTAAVFVIVAGKPIRASAADANFYVAWMDNLLEKTSPGGVWSSYFPTSRSAAQARYQAAKTTFQQIAAEASVP